MVLEFKLYEVTSHNDVEVTDEHTVKQLQVLTGDSAILISEWFYQKYGNVLLGDYREPNHYISFTGEELLELLKILEYVLWGNKSNKLNQYFKALYYFPLNYVKVNLNLDYALKPFTDEYITALNDLYVILKDIIGDDDILNRERLFLYNVSW